MATERITEIPDIADALCDGGPHVERVQGWDRNRNREVREYRVILPGLLQQMRELFEPVGDPDSGSTAAVSKPPVRWDAMADHTQIAIASVRWCWLLRLDLRPTVEGNIRQLVGASMDSDVRRRLQVEMQRWLRWAETVTGWRSPPMDPRAPCPAINPDTDAECAARTLRVNLSAEEAYCGTCGTLWDRATLPLLGESLKAYHRVRDAEAREARRRARAEAVAERRAREEHAA
jgi:hypothetical protein